MDSSELEDLTQHINDKISGVMKILHLRTLAKDPDKRNMLKKISQDLLSINNLLNQFEAQVNQQKEILKSLKGLEKLFEEDVKQAKHLKENIPPHIPRKGPVQSSAAVLKTSQGPESNKELELSKKPSKHKDCIREMLFITTAEFENIPAATLFNDLLENLLFLIQRIKMDLHGPRMTNLLLLMTIAHDVTSVPNFLENIYGIHRYMKGRFTYDQINNVIQDINKAVVCKYKILKQSLKSMNNATRKLYQRFKDEECKETKGQYFIVDADIKEFTQMKVEKKFHVMLNMLRHCQRLREVRGGGIIRYMLQ